MGTVVAGTLKHGIIVPGATLMLGPDIGDGTFKLTAIKSIHYKRLPVAQVGADPACLCAMLAARGVCSTRPAGTHCCTLHASTDYFKAP